MGLRNSPPAWSLGRLHPGSAGHPRSLRQHPSESLNMEKMPITKLCIGCDEVKPAPAFFVSAFTPDGLTSCCRSCVFEKARANRAERERRRNSRQLAR